MELILLNSQLLHQLGSSLGLDWFGETLLGFLFFVTC